MPEEARSESAEVLRRAIAALADQDLDAALSDVHPDIEWIAPPEWLEQRVYEGHDQLRQLVGYWVQNFDEYRLDLDRLIDLADGRVVALLFQRGRGKGGGAPVELPVGWVAEFDAGRLRRMHVYFSWEATLRATGLDERAGGG